MELPHLLHAANVLFLLSYAARDVLWLRLLTFGGLSCLVGLALAVPTGDWIPVYWNTAFLALNGYHIAVLFYARRPLRMTPDEARLRELVFADLAEPQCAALFRAAQWSEVAPGGGILAEGDASGRVLVLVRGSALVVHGGVPLADLWPGDFAGEISFLTGEPTSAAVVALEPALCAWWDGRTLRALFDAHPNLRAAVQGILGVDVALKLRGTVPSVSQRRRSISARLSGS